jgi:hypothetical protein
MAPKVALIRHTWPRKMHLLRHHIEGRHSNMAATGPVVSSGRDVSAAKMEGVGAEVVGASASRSCFG